MPYNIASDDGIGWTAGGNITPMRFVKADGTTKRTCVQVSATTDIPIGISGQYVRNVPYSTLNDGYHAIAGEPVQVQNAFNRPILLTAGAAFNANVLLKTTNAGKGVAAGNNEYSCAFAIDESSGDGDAVNVHWLGFGSRAIS